MVAVAACNRSRGPTQCMRRLLDLTPLLIVQDGLTPIQVAMREKFPAVVSILLLRPKKDTSITPAVMLGQQNQVGCCRGSSAAPCSSLGVFREPLPGCHGGSPACRLYSSSYM